MRAGLYDSYLLSGIGGPDDADPPEIPLFKCSHCGAFLPRKPVRSEYWERKLSCDGSPGNYCDPFGEAIPHAPHDSVIDYGETAIRECKRCGQESKFDF